MVEEGGVSGAPHNETGTTTHFQLSEALGVLARGDPVEVFKCRLGYVHVRRVHVDANDSNVVECHGSEE